LNYNLREDWLVNGGVHLNKFGDAHLVDFASTISLMAWDEYAGYTIGSKYVVPGVGTQLAVNYSYSKFTNDAGSVEGPKVSTLALGIKHPIGAVSIGAEFATGRFLNFTEGKDTALMLMRDGRLSKRTMLYLCAGDVRDDRGHAASTDGIDPAGGRMRVAGGPAPLLFSLGSTELPFFAGGGLNIAATTTVIAWGIRHDDRRINASPFRRPFVAWRSRCRSDPHQSS
jgi:hypothetical protein